AAETSFNVPYAHDRPPFAQQALVETGRNLAYSHPAEMPCEICRNRFRAGASKCERQGHLAVERNGRHRRRQGAAIRPSSPRRTWDGWVRSRLDVACSSSSGSSPMLLGAVLLSALAKRIAAPYPALLALGGAVLAFVPGAPRIVLEPDLALALFAPTILL